MSTEDEKRQETVSTDMKRSPLKIMPLGDSITVGYTDNNTWGHPFSFGYRAPLYKLLMEAGIDFEFTGESEEPFDNRFGDPTFGGMIHPPFDLREIGADHHRGLWWLGNRTDCRLCQRMGQYR